MLLVVVSSASALVWRATPLTSLSVSGGDAGAFLHAMLSGGVASLGRGRSCEACLLTMGSHVVDLVTVARSDEACEDSYVLLCEEAARVEKELRKRIIAEDVAVAQTGGAVFDVTEGEAPPGLGSPGGGSDFEGLARAALALEGSGAAKVEDAWLLGGTSLGPGAVGGRVAVAGGASSSDAQSGCAAWEATRIRAGRPRAGFEFSDEEPRFPLELGLGFACDADKGCYLGAELVNKMRKARSLKAALRRVALDPGGPSEGAGKVLATSVDAENGFALAVGDGAAKRRFDVTSTSGGLDARVREERPAFHERSER